ncbi:hypothetical protein [Flavobacterium collinsii]|uniref:Lipoprotein n=1 Tax=Flavobacterium collinsii TaxID=1114861 RepID=A0A9W4TDU5_9FLAO|nr:hypothetical protein [Flavobacterium collinsii]CAI2765260.1 conserved exported protein of unknown function [Flavobacterium collinsii]
MTRKVHIVFLFLTFGFLLMSNASYACGKTTKKTTCEKKAVSKKEVSDTSEKNCCKKEDSSKNDSHGCSRKCDHSGCTTSGLQFSIIAMNEFEFKQNRFNFSVEKTTPYYKNISISDGFTSIWAPPKIK